MKRENKSKQYYYTHLFRQGELDLCLVILHEAAVALGIRAQNGRKFPPHTIRFHEILSGQGMGDRQEDQSFFAKKR